VYVLVYVVLLPRIALPCNDTRALFAAVDVVRLRTLRDGFVVVRATTLRDEFVFAAVVRDVVVRAATLRALFAVFVAVVVVSRRDTTFVPLRREFVAVARGDCVVVNIVFAGAIGSANTARIDTSVEQTKNAPANKNTVPMAFLQKSATLRLVINILPFRGEIPRKPVV